MINSAFLNVNCGIYSTEMNKESVKHWKLILFNR